VIVSALPSASFWMISLDLLLLSPFSWSLWQLPTLEPQKGDLIDKKRLAITYRFLDYKASMSCKLPKDRPSHVDLQDELVSIFEFHRLVQVSILFGDSGCMI
jgi:hypothetical protein